MFKILKWAVIVVVVGFVALVVGRVVFFIQRDKTEAQVERIHNTKLALADVMGERLPSVPENPDGTIAGVDENKNGIRDDVELAIFAAYPNSARTRAVLLQYALALKEQARNKRNNSFIEFRGKKHTISDWAEKLGIKISTLHARIRYSKWPIEKSFSTPVQSKVIS